MKLLLVIILASAVVAFAETAAPTIESLTAENVSLKAQLASAQAHIRLMAVQSSVDKQVCDLPDLLTAKAVAAEADKKAQALATPLPAKRTE